MSPQRDDVPALIHALAHNFRLFAPLFSANNSCFLVHSSLCGGSMHHLSIAFSHLATLSEYAQRHTRAHKDTPLWLKHLPRMTKTWYYLLLFIIADAAIISWPRCLSPSSPCMCSFIQISITFSLFLAMAPLLMFMFIQTHLPLSVLAPTSSSLPHCTRVSSFCYKPRFHNNCDLSVMPNHF